MKFLLDENVPNMYKKELEKYGYRDIKRINDFGKGLPDEEVFNVAVREKRTIITIDTDFHNFKKQSHCGIISISGKLVKPIDLIVSTLQQMKKDMTINKYIFDDTFIRITWQYFIVGYKKKGKYREIKRRHKK